MNLPKRKRAPVLIDAVSAPTEVSPTPRSRPLREKVTRLRIEHSRVLAIQPVELAELLPAQRREIVVSAVVDDDGVEHVVSRFSDDVWILDSVWQTQNTIESDRKVKWDPKLPPDLLGDAKAAIYAYWKRGRDGEQLPAPRTIHAYAEAGQVTLREFATAGVQRFSEITPRMLADHLSDIREQLTLSRCLTRFWLLDLVWSFRDDLTWPMTADPWGGKTLSTWVGPATDSSDKSSGASAKTAVIPVSVQSRLFAYAEQVLGSAEDRFRRRDEGRVRYWAPELIEIRDAALYLVQITTGMRNSESTGIKLNSWRNERIAGQLVNWITSFEHKGGHGLVDFLAPSEAIDALKLVGRYAEPFQDRLRREAQLLTNRLKIDANLKGKDRVAAISRLALVRASEQYLFLGLNKYESDGLENELRVEVMTRGGCSSALSRLAGAAGVDWTPTNMECRRTFAWTVANSTLGRHGLVFIKWQLKHRTIRLAELYGSNPRQDPTLYREFEDEIWRAQGELVSSWFEEDEPLSGGAGRQIVESRAIAVRDRAQLVESASEAVTIRSTGHSWCLAEQDGCVGQGIYEAYRCGGCSAGVIDSSQAETWQQIHLHNLELASIKDCGQAVQDRARREIAASTRVLRELGVALPTGGSVES